MTIKVDIVDVVMVFVFVSHRGIVGVANVGKISMQLCSLFFYDNLKCFFFDNLKKSVQMLSFY